MDLGLRGKAAVVTGGSKGISYAAAKGVPGRPAEICARHEGNCGRQQGNWKQLGGLFTGRPWMTGCPGQLCDFAETCIPAFWQLMSQ